MSILFLSGFAIDPPDNSTEVRKKYLNRPLIRVSAN